MRQPANGRPFGAAAPPMGRENPRRALAESAGAAQLLAMTLPPERPRERMFNAPGVVVGVVALLVAIHALRMALLSEEADVGILLDYAFIPLRSFLWLWPDDAAAVADRIAQAGGAEAARQIALLRYLVEEQAGRPWTVLTYAFLHGNWAHVVLNCAWLMAFATPLGRRIGAVRTLVFLALTAIAGALTHFAIHPEAAVPVIGASAAASGAMAAAMRFAYGPRGPSTIQAAFGPVRSLAEVARDRNVMIFFGVWFALNLVFGVFAEPLGIAPGGIAWEAHIGGFVAGFVLMPWIDRRPRVHD